jgi:hypothetical protein
VSAKKTTKPKPKPAPKVKTAKTYAEQVEVGGVTLADVKKMLLPLGLDDAFENVIVTIFTACSAAVKEGKGAAMAVAFSTFFPILEALSTDVGSWARSMRRRNDAEAIERLVNAISALDYIDESMTDALKVKLTERLDSLVDQLFPAPFSLTMGISPPDAIDPATLGPHLTPIRPDEPVQPDELAVRMDEYMREEKGAVEPAPEPKFKIEDGNGAEPPLGAVGSTTEELE